MKKLLTVFILLVLFQFKSISQIQFLTSEILKVEHKVGQQLFELMIVNNSDSSFFYNWIKQHPAELSDYADIEIWDSNAQYVSQLNSSCIAMSPNHILGLDTVHFTVNIVMESLIPEEEMILFDSLFVQLVDHPECIRIYDELNFETIETTSVIQTEKLNIFISPNPVEEVIYIRNRESNESKYRIFNSQGYIVQEGIIIENEISLEFEKEGMYFIKIIDQDLEQSFQFYKI